MPLLQLDHITDIYVLVDELLERPEKRTVGRPRALSESEVITILLWSSLMPTKQKTVKDIHRWVQLYHEKEFPTLPKYNAFLVACHASLPAMEHVLKQLLVSTARTRLMDSTMLQVCKLVRAKRHRVAANSATFGKNHQGWHYGFKLHAAINPYGQLAAYTFTPANEHDLHSIPHLVNNSTDIAVGDSHYGASVMKKNIWTQFKCAIFSPPHHTQKRKMATWWQNELLSMRSTVESTFDYLKNHMHLVSSFPRSLKGYFVHYIRILLGYQFISLISAK